MEKEILKIEVENGQIQVQAKCSSDMSKSIAISMGDNEDMAEIIMDAVGYYIEILKMKANEK